MELWGYPVGDLYLWEATMVPALQHRGNKGTGQDPVWEKAVMIAIIEQGLHTVYRQWAVARAEWMQAKSGVNLSGGKFVTTENECECHRSLKSEVYPEA